MRIFINRILTNANVTEHNFDIIRKAADKTGYEVVDYASIQDCINDGSKQDVYVTTGVFETLRLAIRGRRRIIMWVQGIIPEESYMRNQSVLRYRTLSIMEKLSLRFTRHLLLVSNAMRNHYEKKYGLNLSDKYSVFPCYNTNISEEAFNSLDKYSNNVFVYAGGLAEWQCFDETLDIYKKIEDWNIPGTKLLVLTANKELANKKILERSIQHYEIGFVPKEEMPKTVANAKFGFVIRKDSPVNEVSTPTKISTYLSCGLIPIFGESIQSFVEQAKKMKYAIPYSTFENSSIKIREFMEDPINNQDVYCEYKQIFDTYFSDANYIDRISSIIKTISYEDNK